MAKTLSLKQKKMKVLEQLQAFGIKDELSFITMTAADMVKAFPDLSKEEFRIICDMQDAVHDNTLFSFLSAD